MGYKYWLILRALANHFLPIWCKYPHLILGMEKFILDLAVARELRTDDA